MSDSLRRIYYSAPFPLRSAAVSLWGVYLRHWRYGPETEQLVEEILERDSWSISSWRSWQEERLAYILDRSAKRVPYYRAYWSERRRRGDSRSWERLENWPILHKDEVRKHSSAFIADDRDQRRMFRDQTSGTTGKPLQIWLSRDAVRMHYALFEARCRRWHGVSRHDRWALLGGQLVTPVERKRPPFWIWNRGLNQLYCSSYHLAPELVPMYLEALRKFEIRYIMGYASSLNALACNAKTNSKLNFRVAISIAEPLFEYQRKAISSTFGCAARETYGMAEIVVSAAECEKGSLHIQPERGVLEVLNPETGHAVPAGHSGELIATGLLNSDMPLIRYRTGDRIALAPQTERCTCGRTLPIVMALEGRTDDVLYTPDGRIIGRLDPVFKASLPILEAQIIQERIDEVRLRYVPADGFDSFAARALINRIQERMGPITVVLESVPTIPRERNGKFRAVVCKIPSIRAQGLTNREDILV